MTSLPLMSCLKISAPCGLPRSNVMQRLLRDTDFHQSGMPSMIGSSFRCPSPYFGCSILMTSAPKSASNTVANGAATILPASITRTPLSGLFSLFLVSGKSKCSFIYSPITCQRPHSRFSCCGNLPLVAGILPTKGTGNKPIKRCPRNSLSNQLRSKTAAEKKDINETLSNCPPPECFYPGGHSEVSPVVSSVEPPLKACGNDGL